MILGAIGPIQMLVLLVLPILVVVGLILLFVSRAKHKTKAEMLEKQLEEKKQENKGLFRK